MTCVWVFASCFPKSLPAAALTAEPRLSAPRSPHPTSWPRLVPATHHASSNRDRDLPLPGGWPAQDRSWRVGEVSGVWGSVQRRVPHPAGPCRHAGRPGVADRAQSAHCHGPRTPIVCMLIAPGQGRDRPDRVVSVGEMNDRGEVSKQIAVGPGARTLRCRDTRPLKPPAAPSIRRRWLRRSGRNRPPRRECRPGPHARRLCPGRRRWRARVRAPMSAPSRSPV